MWDQTDHQWLTNLKFSDPGTGVFLVPAPNDESIKAVRKMHVGGITYPMCVRLGGDIHAVAIKWVPETIASIGDLRDTTCTRRECKDTCVKPGCLCNPDTNVCE
jgi:hypothetical protein